MKKYSFSFTVFLLSLTVVDVIAEQPTTTTSQQSKDKALNDNTNKKGGMTAGSADKNGLTGFESNFFRELSEEEKVTQENINKNKSVLNESVKKNQSGFLGWLGRFFGNIADELNTDRIVDFLWYKSKMEHEDNEEYKSTKNKIERYHIKKAFIKLIKKVFGRDIDEETTHKFHDEYDKINRISCLLGEEDANNFGEDSLRLMTLEKIFGDRETGIYDILSSLSDVSEDKINELQALFADLKMNEDEFLKCFTAMSAVEKYNLERDARYNEKENESYCKSQWLKVDKEGFHDTSRGFLTWFKIVWKFVRLAIGFLVYFIVLTGLVLHDDSPIRIGGGNNSTVWDNDHTRSMLFFNVAHCLLCLPMFVGHFKGFKNGFCNVQCITSIFNLIISLAHCFDKLENENSIIFKTVNYLIFISMLITIICSLIEGCIRLPGMFKNAINKNLAFLINKKFKYIKNYIETLKKIHMIIKENDILARTFEKELVSLESIFGNGASEETKHLLKEIDKQNLYDSFDDVKDTGEAMFLFDKNKDIFSKTIVDVNKINVCLLLNKKKDSIIKQNETEKITKSKSEEKTRKESESKSEDVARRKGNKVKNARKTKEKRREGTREKNKRTNKNLKKRNKSKNK